MKAIYPGSFNPWTEGHEDILRKALASFREVTVVVMQNPEKSEGYEIDEDALKAIGAETIGNVRVVVTTDRKLDDVIRKTEADAVVRGLRGADDIAYERNFQYWCEDVGIEVPFVFYLADRNLVHISSSAVRSARSLGYEPGPKK